MKESRLANGIVGGCISVAAALLVILVFEIFLRYSHVPPYLWDFRLMFFSEGDVFENKRWGGFVYAPNARIHSATYYITNLSSQGLTKEYEYDIATNSFGLVQRNDIDGSKPSILFLGDSYTEGQGATPWFYDFEAHWPKNSPYQVINGGILGTGIEAWERLYEDVSATAKIEKVVVIFISDDWRRRVWQFLPQSLECLRFASRCSGADSFFGLPENPAEAAVQIGRISKSRLDFVAKEKESQGFIRSSQIFQQLLRPVYQQWRPPYRAEFEKNKLAALRLVAELGAQNVLFIHLPQKDELEHGPNVLGKQARTFIGESGWLLVDGFEKCSLTIMDFHPNDGHPNAVGYRKLEKCISEFVSDAFHLGLT